jgi:hypothetical protein
MQTELITVRPHPDNPGGYCIYKGSEMAKFLNQNWFLDHGHALQVAHAMRHAVYRQTISEILGKVLI